MQLLLNLIGVHFEKVGMHQHYICHLSMLSLLLVLLLLVLVLLLQGRSKVLGGNVVIMKCLGDDAVKKLHCSVSK